MNRIIKLGKFALMALAVTLISSATTPLHAAKKYDRVCYKGAVELFDACEGSVEVC